MRDAQGRILFGAAGEENEDPNAVWPRVVGEMSISEPLGAVAHEESRPTQPNDENEGADPPTSVRVARRALALTAVTARAILEQDNTTLKSGPASRSPLRRLRGMFSGRDRERLELLAWIRNIGIEDELEPDEWEIIQRPIGRLVPRQQIDSTWRLEGLAVLGWALGRFEVPSHDQLVDFRLLWSKLGLLDIHVAKELLAGPALRTREEIINRRNRLFAIHWRLRNYKLRPEVMNFAEFARTCWFGPLDLSGLPFNDGDLALKGLRIDRASKDLFSTAHSAVSERHKAANWLREGPLRYSEASEAT
jgi:hypothetical protein